MTEGYDMTQETPAQALLQWYDEHKRDLPWRDDPSPYHVWLSEIMLQQTRVEAVRRYYARFLEALPQIGDLAEADEDVYLKLWEGLGYYSRVRNLHKAARQVMDEHGGKMPESSAELRKLAGIGPYTSAAIASICFGERIPALDGNLLRVFARVTGYAENIRTDKAKKAAMEYYLETFPDERPGDYNQALMDLGAGVCLPNGTPLCGSCPWETICAARASGQETELPLIPAKKKRAVDEKTVFLIYYDQRLALRKRPEKGLLAGLYEYPNAEGLLDETAAAEAVRSFGFDTVRIRRIDDAKHIFTHREWHMRGYQVLADDWEEFADEHPRSHEVFLAKAGDLENRFSVPSAFSGFTKQIRLEYLEEV